MRVTVNCSAGKSNYPPTRLIFLPRGMGFYSLVLVGKMVIITIFVPQNSEKDGNGSPIEQS